MSPRGLVHQALVYSTEDEFLESTLPFVRDGLAQGDSVLAVTSHPNIESLRRILAREATGVEFHDAADWYQSPARTLHAFGRYVEEHRDGGRVRVIGEPMWSGLSTAGVREWARSESLLNVAFAGLPAWIVCAYDASELPPAVVAHAFETHPEVCVGARASASPYFLEPETFCSKVDEETLEEPSVPTAELDLEGDLSKLRRLATGEAAAAGLPSGRIPDLVLAANEVATNALLHGAGAVRARAWAQSGELVLEVADLGGHPFDSLAGYVQPDPGDTGGWGLWVTRQLCDLVEIRSTTTATIVRLHMSLV